MAIVVEDGTGLSNAESYGSVADADTYHTARGNTVWTDATTPNKETALVRATDYIDRRFGDRFLGTRETSGQALAWPRVDAWDRDEFILSGVPTKLKQALFEYALRALLIHELSPDPARNVNTQSHVTGVTNPTTPTGQVQKTRRKIGPIEKEDAYRTAGTDLIAAGNSPKSTLVSDFFIPEYPAADMKIEPLLKSSASTRLVRC
jgi:hypothetical protein